MKLDRVNCLGGRFNNKEVLGIMCNGYRIYPAEEENFIIVFTKETNELSNSIDYYKILPENIAYTIDTYTYGKLTFFEIRSNYTGALSVEFFYIKDIKRLKGEFEKIDFDGCEESMNLNEVNTKRMTDMSHMFGGCHHLTELNLSNFDTSNVTNMSSMFYLCYELIELNLNNFNTSNVTDMGSMFDSCMKLTKIKGIEDFDTSNVTNMEYMFDGCYVLTTLDLSSFNTSNVTNMHRMFYNCNGITTLDLSSFNISNVTNMNGMFGNCSRLTKLDLSSFKNNKVTDISYMFASCVSLTEVDLSNFNASRIADSNGLRWVFYGCDKLHTIRFDNCDNDTIYKIIHSTLFPHEEITDSKGNIIPRKIYVNPDNLTNPNNPDENLTPPSGWKFYNCNTNEEIVTD